MKPMCKTIGIVLASILTIISCAPDNRFLAVDKSGKTVVERFGQLQVMGTRLGTQEGKPVQLRGMSSFGLQWAGKYANDEVIQWLRDDWNMQVWRAAMYLTQGGYIENPVIKEKVISSIEAALKLGIYVIVDWHVLSDKNPLVYKDKAIEFFTDIAQKYGTYPNIIYEICNEPNGKEVTWQGQIKPYAEAVIGAIRAIDPDNIIIVGTPNWSQDVDVAAEDPIKDYKNIMYTLHFYAGTHGEALRKKAEKALAKGLPIFVTEWGTSDASGGGGFYPDQSKVWLSFLKKHGISWVNWSVNNKGEESGTLVYNADREGKGRWQDADLSPSGRFIRKVLRNEIRIP
ncbi:glycoside hydrolase family 5 protein [Gracilinema caldarium]|uniref:glycoside hydrolase family 5 protein n=1 Tax=Gracilinema caldarium TaxID=215591 RepID=UPI0026F060A3|nr:glycoside hydrolase family 5 protein [Gracilinema caldarium]